MADAIELATAYVQVIPSLQGAQGAMTAALVPGATAAGATAGTAASTSFAARFGAGVAAIGVGRLAGLGVLAAAAIGAGLYSVGSTFDELNDTIRTKTGESGAALDGLVDSARNVGANVPVEFDKIGPVIAGLNQRLDLSGDTLETVASQYLEAGRILGQEVDIQKTSQAFSAFSIKGAEVEGAMDSLFQVSQTTGVEMNRLAGIVAKNAAPLQALGFGFEETAAFAGVLDKAGLDANRTMTSMGRALVTLAQDGEAPQDAFKRVTGEIAALSAQGKDAAAIDLAAQLFGTKGAPQFVKALQDGTISAEALAATIAGSGDTILGVGADTADFAEQWQLVQNNAQLALEPLGSAVFTGLGDALKAMMPGLQGFAAWLADNQWVLGVFGTFIGVTLVAAFYAWAASIWATTVALLANPITWIVIGIVALIAGLVALIANWDAVVGFLRGVWAGVVSWLAGVWDQIASGVAGFGSRIGGFFSGIWTGIVSFAQRTWNGFVGWIGGIPGRILGNLAGLAALAGRAAAWFGGMYDAAVRKVGELVSWVGGIPNRILRALGDIGGILFRAGAGILEGFLRGLRSAWDNVQNFVGGIADWIRQNKGPLPKDYRLLQPAGAAIVRGLGDSMRDEFDYIEAATADLAELLSPSLTTSLSTSSLLDVQAPPSQTAVVEDLIDALLAALEGAEFTIDADTLSTMLAARLTLSRDRS